MQRIFSWPRTFTSHQLLVAAYGSGVKVKVFFLLCPKKEGKGGEGRRGEGSKVRRTI